MALKIPPGNEHKQRAEQLAQVAKAIARTLVEKGKLLPPKKKS